MIRWIGTVKITLTTAARRLSSRSAPCLCAIALLAGLLGCGGETPTTPPPGGGPGSPPPPPNGAAHFGVDGLAQSRLPTVAQLNDGASGVNGPKWSNIERTPPVGGVHSYGNPSTLIAEANACHALGRKYQLNLSPDSEWALDTGSGTFQDPVTGEAHAKWLSIKPAYKGDWEALIRHVITVIPVDMLQIGSEAENDWDGAAGFAEAVRLAYAVVKAVRPEVTVMTMGCNFGNRFQAPAEPLTAKQVWVRDFIDRSDGDFDVFTLHLTHLPSSFAPTVAWVNAQMAARGYSRPIWSDDMASGPFYQAPWSTAEELALQAAVETGDPGAVLQYATEQAKYAVRKPVTAFAAGVQRVFLSSDTDWPDYYIPLWRYQGLVRVDGVRKPAFYSYQQLIAEVGGFVGVERAGETTFKFSFAGKAPVVVVWSEGPLGAVDLSGVLPGGMVRLKTPVTTLDSNLQPIRIPDVVVSSTTVPISTTPVFVTLAN